MPRVEREEALRETETERAEFQKKNSAFARQAENNIGFAKLRENECSLVKCESSDSFSDVIPKKV